MKLFKYFLTGLVFLLFVESGVFLFLDKVYLNDNTSYHSEKLTDGAKKKLKNVKIDDGDNVTNIQCSYDGSYVTFLKDHTLTIIDLTTGKKSTIKSENHYTTVGYQWIYDRNRIVIAEKTNEDSEKQYLKIYYYDAADKVKTEVDNALDGKVLTIPLKNKSVSVTGIEMSTLTNLTYFKLTDDENKSQVYRINVNVDKSRLSTRSNIGKILALKNDDTFLYEDTKNGHVYQYSTGLPVRIEGDQNLKILGIDSEDNVYFALSNKDKTNLIYFGNLKENDFKKCKLDESVNYSDITIGLDGGIYYNESKNGILKNLLSGTETSYDGQLIGIYSGGFLTRSKGKITDNSFQSE